MPSIVSITSKTLVQSHSYFPWYGNQEYYTTGAGSGIIISKTNSELLILTNYHVVADTKEIVVSFIDEENVNASIKGFSERKDVAVISVKLSDIKKETIEAIRIATLGNSEELKVGNGIIAIGNALGYGQSVTVGVVSALNREVSTDSYTNKMIQLDAAINGGNSGGALLNSRGEVVGINSAKYSSNGSGTSVEGMGFAIPISDVTTLIKDLSAGKEDSNGAVLGIQGYMIDEETSKAQNMPVGFYITSIVEGSGADKSELELGNIITKIDKVKVESFDDLSNYLYEKKAGDKVTLTVKYISGRSYKEKEVNVTLSK
jgi:serine protease Do